MPQITLAFRVVDVDGHDIHDPAVIVRLEAANSGRVTEAQLQLRGQPVRRLVEAPAGSALKLRISPSRFRDAQMVGMVINDTLSLPEPFVVPRRPDSWQPVFVPWGALPAEFASFQKVLRDSKAFRLGRDSAPGQLTDANYDAVGAVDESRFLAKMCLLNLCARLRTEAIPGASGVWLDEVQQLLVAQRDRCFAEVTGTFFNAVKKLSNQGTEGYGRTNAENHRGRVAGLPEVSHVGEMFSVKSKEAKGNIQLTVAKATRQGTAAFLLDADVDERGTLLGHTFEFIRNFLTKHETHPIDVHEAFRVKFPALALGVALEPWTAVGEVTARIVEVRGVDAPEAAAAREAARTGPFKPKRIAVLGDSVPWGQGLLDAQKVHQLVAAVYGSSGTPPATTMVAHSGAVIGVGAVDDGRSVCNGEVPTGRPTILHQVARYPKGDAGKVNLVILNGGINDVDVRVILNPFTSPTLLTDKTTRACGLDLRVLLDAALARFPKARIAVLAYFPILSPLSRFGEGQQFVTALGTPPPVAPLTATAGERFFIWDRIVENCGVFHKVSTAAMQDAVDGANAGAGADRCVLVDPGFLDEHAALAPKARLFGISWDFSPQDPVAGQRRVACDQCQPDPLRREQCYRASAGHPNPDGAEAYATAIVAALG